MQAELTEIGRVAHYYPKINVAVIELKGAVSLGDRILIKGATTSLEQTVDSMEVEHKPVSRAESGQSVGLRVTGRVRENDLVFRKA